MSDPFDFKPPKEFGDRNDVAVAKLKGLHDIPNLGYSKSLLPGVRIIRGAFDTVTVDPLPQPKLGRLITWGYTDSIYGYVKASFGGRAPFSTRPLYFSTNNLNADLNLGVKSSVQGVRPNNPNGGGGVGGVPERVRFDVFRSKNLTNTVLETQDYMSQIAVGSFDNWSYYPTYLFASPASYWKVGAAPATEYETIAWSNFDGTDSVTPRVAYKDADGWAYALGLQAYADCNHLTAFAAQIEPSAHLIGHTPWAKSLVYDAFASTPRAGYPPELGASGAPNPPWALFQLSIDGGRSYSYANFDALVAGLTLTSAVTPSRAEAYFVLRSLQVQCLADAVFFSLQTGIGETDEVRIFRSATATLNSLALVATPPGYAVTWGPVPGTNSITGTLFDYGGCFRAAFAVSTPSAGKYVGQIGYVAKAPRWNLSDLSGTNLPDLLFVSKDKGASWEAPRPLPCIGRYGGALRALSATVLGLPVYEPTSPPNMVLYTSRDLGLTWQRGTVIHAGVVDLGSHPYNDGYSVGNFGVVLAYDNVDGTPPSPTPMSPHVYDSRAPRSTAHL